MKKYVYFSPILVVCILIFSFYTPNSSTIESEKGVQFFKGNFKEARILAQKEKKLIFIDFYATWCGSCKKLQAKTLSTETVGNYLNKNYINLAVDVDTDDGGALAQFYKITALPTLMVLDENGKIVRQSVGYQNTHSLLEFANLNTTP